MCGSAFPFPLPCPVPLCPHGSDFLLQVSNVPAEEDLLCNEAEDLLWSPLNSRKKWMVIAAPTTSPLCGVGSALASVADEQEVDASLCWLAAPALTVPSAST